MLMKSSILIITSIVLSACTSLGVPVTEYQARSYEDIESFVYRNFSSGPESYFVKATPEDIKQGILWEARFTSMNRMYLHKPSKDLRTYCNANGGILQNTPVADGFSIKERYVAALNAVRANASANSCIQTGANNIEYNRCAGTSPAASMARARHETSAQIAVSAAKQFGSEYAWLDSEIHEAERNGSLGVFECSVDGNIEWVATAHIEGFRTGGGTNNQLVTPMALIRIKGESVR